MKQPPTAQLMLLVLASGAFCGAFSPVHHCGSLFASTTSVPPVTTTASSITTPFFALPSNHYNHEKNNRNLWQQVLGRLDTVETAGYNGSDDRVLAAGLFGKIKQLHNPITYFVLGILAGFRWDWCFKSPLYWFAIGFTIKWYRARYVFKIPVWDRQPNWNNIITNKEQEKDLKAYTCKKCGSTIFIAKTREFFFEGNTGIGGLGCFACGAKGKENFVMDRDRIIEDVGDMDDYFEYERPLDFVSRAERRKLLKEAQGDEERANQLLLDRAAAAAAAAAAGTTATAVETKLAAGTEDFVDAVLEEESPAGVVVEKESVSEPGMELEEAPKASAEIEQEIAVTPDVVEEPPVAHDVEEVSHEPVDELAKKVKKVKAQKPAPPNPGSSPSKGGLDLDGLDELGMDAW